MALFILLETLKWEVWAVFAMCHRFFFAHCLIWFVLPLDELWLYLLFLFCSHFICLVTISRRLSPIACDQHEWKVNGTTSDESKMKQKFPIQAQHDTRAHLSCLPGLFVSLLKKKAHKNVKWGVKFILFE